ncbi:MAG: hypothetical protein ACMG6H_04640, partial [Acidobacteriota bacterium]
MNPRKDCPLKKIPFEMAQKIYTLIENSFKVRLSVYEEAILAIGALAGKIEEKAAVDRRWLQLL